MFAICTHDNLTYLEYDDWGASRNNEYTCLLTSPLDTLYKIT